MSTLDPFLTVLALANQANPSHPVPFDRDSVSLVGVDVTTRPDHEVNAKITVAGIPADGYTGQASFFYARHDLSQDFAGAGIVPTLPLDGVVSWQTLADALNARYNTQLSAVDLPLLPWPHPGVGALTFPIAATSLFYSGSFVVQLTPFVGAVPLSDAIVVRDFAGLVGP